MSVIISLLLMGGGIGGYLIYKHKHKPQKVTHGNYYVDNFCDNNTTQLSEANSIGVAPMDTDADYEKRVNEGKLVRLMDNSNFYLSDVKYPHVVPRTVELLDSIGARYRRNIGTFGEKLKVTSATRTTAYQRKLSKGNVNATQNSCHTRGTTIDISYAPLSSKEKKALGEALLSLRNEGRCYVKYEQRQPCFHITAR